MNVIHIAYLLTGSAVCLFLILFAVSSISESKPRAAFFSSIALLAFGALWFGGYFFGAERSLLLVPGLVTLLLAAALYFLPIGKSLALEAGKITEKVDERSTMFAREEYAPGTEKYEKYYAMHPEHQEIDDKIRQLPELMAPGSRYYDPVRSAQVRSTFAVIKELTTRVDGPVGRDRVDFDPATITADIKEMVKRLGGDEVGIAELNPMHVYSHVGRGPEPWGTPIENNHKYAICYTLEMDYDRVEEAPALAITEETVVQYLRGAQISVHLADYIRKLGYPARAHISESNYQIILPAVANDAGLGEIGRHGYLISPKFGSRVRLGGVTTDLPLVPDKPITFGVQDFCDKCKKCAINCPSAAIPDGAKTSVRGVEKWPLCVEQCTRYWRMAGTDCGLCMRVCPFSHPPTLVHGVIKAGIKRSALARTVSVWGDDLFYGRKAKWERN